MHLGTDSTDKLKKNNLMNVSKWVPLLWKYTLIIRLRKVCNLTQIYHVNSSILQHQKFDEVILLLYCAFICHLLHLPTHANWNYNRKHIPVNGENQTPVHKTILIKN
jgi:hypothetical protein